MTDALDGMVRRCDAIIRRNNAALNEVDGITPIPEVVGLRNAAVHRVKYD